MARGGRERALDTALNTIRKRFGEGAVMKLGGASHLDVEAISTGCLSLDIALGIGGVPRGRITEIYGPEGSGKTTLCLHAVAEAQRLGGTAAIIDVEHALDPSYAATCGEFSKPGLVPAPSMTASTPACRSGPRSSHGSPLRRPFEPGSRCPKVCETRLGAKRSRTDCAWRGSSIPADRCTGSTLR